MKRIITNFSTPVLNFIEILSFNIKNIYLMGTMSERVLNYPSDYDLFEDIKTTFKNKTEAISYYEKGLKDIVKKLTLQDDCLISKLILGLENDNPKKWDAKDFLNQNLKPYIEQDSLIKIDAIKLIDGIYSDFSCVYQFFNNDKKINNFELFKPDDLNKDIKKFKQEKNYFKMAKRIYALTGNENLITLFNSNLGKMSQIISNIETIIFMLEHNRVSLKKIQNEINIIINKLSSIDDEEFLNREKQIVNKLKRISDYKNEKKNYNSIVKILNNLNNFLFKILQKNTKLWLKENKIN